MVVFRLIQGTAGAAMAPSSPAIMMETFRPHEQQMAMDTWSMGLMVAPVMGPTVKGWITDNWSWRWNFYINLPIGIVAILMVSAFWLGFSKGAPSNWTGRGRRFNERAR